MRVVSSQFGFALVFKDLKDRCNLMRMLSGMKSTQTVLMLTTTGCSAPAFDEAEELKAVFSEPIDDKYNVGDGYRLVEVGEMIFEEDEYEVGGGWQQTGMHGAVLGTPYTSDSRYRRKNPS